MTDRPSSRWSDLDRPGLDQDALQSVLRRDGSLWTSLQVLPEVGSTNAELARAAADGAPEGAVLVAEHQGAGRGRLDRSWVSPARAGLTLSLLLRPDVPAARRGWSTLLTAVALAEAVSEVAGVRPSVKWPNDLLAPGGSKLAGVLAESVGSAELTTAVVVGVGLNVSTRAGELPEGATSLAVVTGGPVDRGPVLLAFLRAFEKRYRGWTAALGDPVGCLLARDYLAWSSTVGTVVDVTMPDGTVLTGTAEAVDWDGRLVLRTDSGSVELAAGDVRHVRRGAAGR